MGMFFKSEQSAQVVKDGSVVDEETILLWTGAETTTRKKMKMKMNGTKNMLFLPPGPALRVLIPRTT
jgi:hypothetical protein